MKRLLSVGLLSFMALTAQAQFRPDADYQRVLVPVFYFGGGAFGAAWWTDFDLLSTGGGFELGVPMLQDNPACPALCGCDVTKVVDLWQAHNICPQFENPAGLLLYVPRTVDRSTVYMGSRVYDRSRQADRFGTEIPLVWESDFLDGPVMLLNLPGDARFRVTLRLYDVYQYPTPFVLRFHDMAKLRSGENEPLFSTIVQVRYEGPIVGGRFPLTPATGIIGDLRAAYPQLAGVGSFAVEVVGTDHDSSPPPPRHRWYTFASITNNTTHEVTVVSPQ